jgi:U2-associated protein SR140
VDWTKTEAESERKEKEKEAMDEVELEKRAIAKIGEKRLQEFDRILFNLTTSRESIKIALACAMENSEYYAQIVDRIKTSVMEENIGIPRRIARLYLVSDLLHNSGCADIKNAWKFRHEFQKHLLEIFVRLRKVFVGINGRITAEAMKERVMIVLRAWNQWSIYPRDLISQLEDTFLGHAPKHSETTEPKSPVQDIPDDYCDPNWDIDGEPLF